MTGLETYTTTKRSIIGIDWLNAASGALKMGAGAFGGSSGAGQGDAATAAALERARLEEQRRQAEQSASNWKMIGIGGVIVVVLGVVLLRKK